MKLCRFVLALGLSLNTCLVCAAEPSARPAELNELDRLVGHWEVAEFVSKKAEWTPREIRSSGDVATTKWIMGGLYLEDRKELANGTEHLAIWHFDPAEKAYHCAMYKAPGGGRRDVTIRWDEKAQSFNGTSALPNGVTMRSTTRFPDENTKVWTAVATDAAGKVYQDITAKEVRILPLLPEVPTIPLANLPAPTERKLPSILTTKPRQPEPGADELQKLLIARHNTAVAEMNAIRTAYECGTAEYNALIDTARRLLLAELESSDSTTDQIASLERFLELAQENEASVKELCDLGAKGGELEKLHAARYLRLDTEIQLLKAKRKDAANK